MMGYYSIFSVIGLLTLRTIQQSREIVDETSERTYIIITSIIVISMSILHGVFAAIAGINAYNISNSGKVGGLVYGPDASAALYYMIKNIKSNAHIRSDDPDYAGHVSFKIDSDSTVYDALCPVQSDSGLSAGNTIKNYMMQCATMRDAPSWYCAMYTAAAATVANCAANVIFGLLTFIIQKRVGNSTTILYYVWVISCLVNGLNTVAWVESGITLVTHYHWRAVMNYLSHKNAKVIVRDRKNVEEIITEYRLCGTEGDPDATKEYSSSNKRVWEEANRLLSEMVDMTNKIWAAALTQFAGGGLALAVYAMTRANGPIDPDTTMGFNALLVGVFTVAGHVANITIIVMLHETTKRSYRCMTKMLELNGIAGDGSDVTSIYTATQAEGLGALLYKPKLRTVDWTVRGCTLNEAIKQFRSVEEVRESDRVMHKKVA